MARRIPRPSQAPVAVATLLMALLVSISAEVAQPCDHESHVPPLHGASLRCDAGGGGGGLARLGPRVPPVPFEGRSGAGQDARNATAAPP